jgi:hypothetical protein
MNPVVPAQAITSGASRDGDGVGELETSYAELFLSTE